MVKSIGDLTWIAFEKEQRALAGFVVIEDNENLGEDVINALEELDWKKLLKKNMSWKDKK